MSDTADEGEARLVEGHRRYALEVRGADRALRLVHQARAPLEGWMERVGEEALVRAADATRREPRFRAATESVVLSEQRCRLWERLTAGPGAARKIG